MSSIPFVGKCFPTAPGFLSYLEALNFGPWRPLYVVAHHTGGPDLETWRKWQTRLKPVSDPQWLINLAGYYGSPPPIGPADGPWQHGPHFMFTPNDYCVLSIPTVRGTHAKSFNANSWCVEMVGDFDRESFDGAVRDKYVEGLAALHVAAGLSLLPYERGHKGLHFHRDDPQTNKTCPGTKVIKADLINRIQAVIDRMTGGEHPAMPIIPGPPAPMTRSGIVIGVAANDTLNVRASASGNSPIVSTLKPNAKVTITGDATNDKTKWLQIDIPGDDDGFVAARFVKEG